MRLEYFRLEDYLLPAIGAGGSLSPATRSCGAGCGWTVPVCLPEPEPEQQATPPRCSLWRRFVLKLRRLGIKRRCFANLGSWLKEIKRGVRRPVSCGRPQAARERVAPGTRVVLTQLGPWARSRGDGAHVGGKAKDILGREYWRCRGFVDLSGGPLAACREKTASSPPRS